MKRIPSSPRFRLRDAWAALLLVLFPLRAAELPTASSAFRAGVEAVQKAAHAHPEKSPAYLAELERGFRELRSRFPEEGETYAELLFIADHTEGEGAVRMAREILEWPAPAAVKDKARGVLRKKAALGGAIALTFTPLGAPDTQPLRTSDWAGKVILVDFWATWCPPCRETLPELRELYARHRAQGLEVVGISFDDDLAKLRRFLKQEKLPWPQVCDGRGWTASPLAAEHGITSLPALWLIDRRGRLRDLDARPDLARKLAALLAETP